MLTTPRTGPVTLAVLHTNEGPETPVAAENLAGYLDSIDAGYHSVCDAQVELVLAPDAMVVEGAGGVNQRSVHGCLVGYAGQSVEQWNDLYSRGELNLMAARFAVWCTKHSLPVRRLTPAEVKAGERGICGHGDVSAVYPASQGHTDPGPNFPWVKFLELVRLAQGVPPVIPTGGGPVTMIALGDGTNGRVATVRPIPAFGVVVIENPGKHRIKGDQASGKNRVWRDKNVPAGAHLIDIADLRPKEQKIVASYELAGDVLTYKGELV